MELDDLFERKQNRNRDNNYLSRKYRNDDDEYGHEDYSGYSEHNHHGQTNWLALLQKVKTNKKLRTAVIISVFLIFLIVAGIIMLLFPFLLKLLKTLSETGIQGTVDSATGFINKLLNGSK